MNHNQFTSIPESVYLCTLPSSYIQFHYTICTFNKSHVICTCIYIHANINICAEHTYIYIPTSAHICVHTRTHTSIQIYDIIQVCTLTTFLYVIIKAITADSYFISYVYVLLTITCIHLWKHITILKVCPHPCALWRSSPCSFFFKWIMCGHCLTLLPLKNKVIEYDMVVVCFLLYTLFVQFDVQPGQWSLTHQNLETISWCDNNSLLYEDQWLVENVQWFVIHTCFALHRTEMLHDSLDCTCFVWGFIIFHYFSIHTIYLSLCLIIWFTITKQYHLCSV